MLLKINVIILLIATGFGGCKNSGESSGRSAEKEPGSAPFPSELVDFIPFSENPVFSGTGSDTWDSSIRERGFIIRENNIYHMWYTGFRYGNEDDTLKVGYATSIDGITWNRYEGNPIFNGSWTEDMMVLKVDSVYYMFAEGRNDIAHMLTSKDKIQWNDYGAIDIRKVDGNPISEGPYGTPTVWWEKGIWYLCYERSDEGIWLATSEDLVVWNNIQDEPVISKGPELYDRYGLAVNQVIKYGDWYYAYYHGTNKEDWSEWSTNVAASKDLVHWTKYEGNPIMRENKSSGIVVYDGKGYRLYTMHNEVAVHFHTAPDSLK